MADAPIYRSWDLTPDEARWLTDKFDNGWELPPKAPWLLRLPGIRLIRALYAWYRVERNATSFARIGIGLGHPNPYDMWVLYAIRRGWC